MARTAHVSDGEEDEGNIDDEDGENMTDEEANIHKNMSYIRCKPSII